MKFIILIVSALAATAFAQLNSANQQTTATGGAGSTIIATGSANAGNSGPAFSGTVAMVTSVSLWLEIKAGVNYLILNV